MEIQRVTAKKVIYCKDPARKSSWEVTMNPPIDQEQFEIIDRIVRSLRNIPDNYLKVSLAVPIQKMTYFQVCRDDGNVWRVELHFEQPDRFSYRRNEKIYMRKHPWTQKKLYAHSVDEVNSLFQEIFCENRVPDLTRWRNCTKEIYLERFRRKKNGCDP